ncbi:MAG: acyl-CoA thioesterase [Alphaproteobacteria bacterium]|nr:acyl-CoA thioesterase [Alphaproteobacteria bacterium]
MTLMLDDRLRADFAVDGDWPILVRHRVRWSEVDAYAHVSHTSYLEWYEDCRIRAMAEVGLDLARDVPGPVLAKIEVEYHKPLHHRDEVLIGARVASYRTTSLVMHYRTWALGKGLVNRATALCVMFVNATGEKVPVPEAARRIWRESHGAKGG